MSMQEGIQTQAGRLILPSPLSTQAGSVTYYNANGGVEAKDKLKLHCQETNRGEKERSRVDASLMTDVEASYKPCKRTDPAITSSKLQALIFAGCKNQGLLRAGPNFVPIPSSFKSSESSTEGLDRILEIALILLKGFKPCP
eukprot:1156641-Pelagomonas_calceolata.AAC.6